MNARYVSVLEPGLNAQGGSPLELHQSQDVTPGLTHEKSMSSRWGAASAHTMSAAASSATSSAIMNTRHG